MLLSIEPTSFYGSNRATLDLVRSIRLSRLTSTAVDTNTSNNEKKKRLGQSNDEKKRNMSKIDKGVRLFPGIKHGVKKPKKKVQKMVKERRAAPIRQQLKEKFDFSRTPYALPRKPRVALNEEGRQKRKFFKTTIQADEPKRNDPPPAPTEFEDINDADEEPFAEIKKDVSKIIHHIDWSDDEDCMKPQLTRKKAVAISNETHNLSYITPSEPFSPQPVTPPNKKEAIKMNDENSQNNVEVNEDPKYYPIFTSPVSHNVLSDVTNKSKKCKTDLIKAASSNDQYQIDAGQKVIGPTECKKCGMVYDIGDPIDEQRHWKYHQNADELKIKSSKNENVVGYSGDDRIILIQHSDPKPKVEKVHSILKQTEDEIGSGYSFEPCWKAFVYIRQGRVIGCVITEPNVEAHRAMPSNGIMLLSDDSYTVKCGINRIWVKSEFRGQKIATTMVNCLRKNFVYGEYLKLDDIAFSVTTADGNEFAKNYTKRDDYLTYSGSN